MRAFALKNLRLEKIPRRTGLYFFVGPKNKILYVGKAANLRERVRSYFAATVSDKVSRLRAEARQLKILPLGSEIEALIEEAAYIKRHRPKYNVLLRDDKNYFFVGFTRERFPRIFVTHQPRQVRNAEFLGPYVSGRALKSTLRLIRRIFPYCTCPKPHARMCLQSQLGLCPGYCCLKSAAPTQKDRRAYAARISRVKKILTGKSAALKRELERELRRAARERRFEDAARIRDELRGLTRILEHRGLLLPLETKEAPEPSGTLPALQKILGMRGFPGRIECYDASVIAGAYAVGAMTAFENGVPDTSGWRLFRMRRRGIPNDPAQIEEMLSRRLTHREWRLPDLIIVDGGVTQLGAVRNTLRKARLVVPSAAIAKGKQKNDRLVFGDPPKLIPVSKLPREVSRLLTRIRNETHRFAISYHRRLRRRTIVRL